jgi:hypothetical protein
MAGRELPARPELDEQVIHPSIARALGALERSGVPWALLRGETELASVDGDVDILAAPSDLQRIRQALSVLGFGVLRSHGRGSHVFFVGYDEHEDAWIKLDVVTDLAFGPYQELLLETDSSACLARSRRVGGLMLLDPGDAFWTLLLHGLLDRGSFSIAQRRRLLELAEQAGPEGSLARALERELPQGSGVERLVALARVGDWAELGRLGPALYTAWISRRPVKARIRMLRNGALRRAGRVPPLRGPGPVISTDQLDPPLAVAVGERFYFPHRFVGLGESRASLGRGLIVARWHAAWGRLVLVDMPDSVRRSALLDRLFGTSRLTLPADLLGERGDAVPAITARVWRDYVRAQT